MTQARRATFKSRMGAFFPGSHVVFRGKVLHRDLHDIDWVELYVFGITGRRFSPGEIRLFHALWVYTSYPDVRIWNNRVAGLGGSARSSGNLSLAAALAVSEAAIYGRGIDIRAADFFVRTHAQVATGVALTDCIKAELSSQRSIAGYGRPLIAGDERIKPMLALAGSLGRADGAYLRLAQAVAEALRAGRWRLQMNYGAIAAALALDLGLSPTEYYYFMFPAFLAGMPPCHIESAARPAGSLFAQACGDVRYSGVSARRWHSDLPSSPTEILP